ncbi:MAG: aminotransferase class I/II-fold pyridoxal phosphate-dependent enzyme [Jiangellaceae bacterium]
MTDLRFHGDRVARPDLLDFAVNVWPARLDGRIRHALRSALDDVTRYPDPEPARSAVAGRHQRPADEVVLLNGACEAFWLLASALRPRHAACVHPSFTEPEAALRAAGVRITRVQRVPADWRLVPSDVPPGADLVVVGNPNNPTGNLDAAGTLAVLARPGRILVIDESFIDLTERPDRSLAGRRDLPGLVVVRSLTKLWGLAGVRAGYLLAPADTAATLDAHRQPWSVNAIALEALRLCTAELTTGPAVAAQVAEARHDLMTRLAPSTSSACGPRRRTSCWSRCPPAGSGSSKGRRPPASQSVRPPASPGLATTTSGSPCGGQPNTPGWPPPSPIWWPRPHLGDRSRARERRSAASAHEECGSGCRVRRPPGRRSTAGGCYPSDGYSPDSPMPSFAW